MQDPYPIFSNAAKIGSWHESDMAIFDSPDFDADLVKQRMKALGVTQTQLAREMGLNQSAISNMLKGDRQVKVHEASFIYRRLGIETAALVAFVPVIGISSAGNWREAIELSAGKVMAPRDAVGTRAFAVEVSGDSMELLLPSGTYAVVDPDQTQLYNEKVYLIENGEHETQIKLYRSNPARFEPASRNETHKTITLGENNVRVIGRVVWQGSPL